MRKTLVSGLVVALVAGCLLAPATAAKKKKPRKPKPPVVAPQPVQTDVNYYLRRSGCGADVNETTLSIVDGPDEDGDDCGAPETGLPTEVMETLGQDPPAAGPLNLGPDATIWNATDGIPFVLDATKEVRASIALTSYCCEPDAPVGVSAGKAKLHAVLTGTADGAEKKIGEATVEYTVTPQTSVYVVEFTIKPDVALDKLSFTTLALKLTNRGVSYLNGFFSVDDPASLITVGTWK